MLLKLCGAVLILFSTSSIGYYFSQRSKYRASDLEEMKKALIIFKGEMDYCAIPLTELLLEISHRTCGCVAEILEEMSERLTEKDGLSVSDEWSGILSKNVNKTYFEQDDMEALFSFGRTLGYSDRNQQISNAKLTVNYIEKTQKELANKYIKDSKLYKSMGVLSGILVCVVLF